MSSNRLTRRMSFSFCLAAGPAASACMCRQNLSFLVVDYIFEILSGRKIELDDSNMMNVMPLSMQAFAENRKYNIDLDT